MEDEYEIDPDQNDGQKFQYHDVRRNREERAKMHGGDCECCKDVSLRFLALCRIVLISTVPSSIIRHWEKSLNTMLDRYGKILLNMI